MESLIKKDLGFKKDCNCKTDEFKSGVVLDPFGGSGTTGIVSALNNRNAILIELNPEYIKIAEDRINKEFGFFNT
jgi:16S rRNA G966 N2-methylase RsmD